MHRAAQLNRFPSPIKESRESRPATNTCRFSPFDTSHLGQGRGGARARAAYHGPWDEIRDDITDAGQIDHSWVEHLPVEGPWNRGRAVVIDDAAHVFPPALALGAAMVLEDAAVLAELLLSVDRLDSDLFDEFTARRRPRVEAVVDGSMQLATWLLECDPSADVPGMARRIPALLATPP